MVRDYPRPFLEFLRDNAEVFDDLKLLHDTWKDWRIQYRIYAFRFFAEECDVFLWDALDKDLISSMSGLLIASSKIGGTFTYPGHVELIPDSCFWGTEDIDKIIVEKGITEIREEAFAHSNLKEISLPEGISYIPPACFDRCKELVKVNIPKSVKWIYDNSFAETKSLKEIVIPDGCNAFSNAFIGSGVEKVTLPKDITIIHDHCFDGCKDLKTISLPDGLKTIDDFAFYNTGIDVLELPQSIRVLGRYVFGRDGNGGRVNIPRECKFKVRGLNKQEAKEWFENQVTTPSKAYHDGYLKKFV